MQLILDFAGGGSPKKPWGRLGLTPGPWSHRIPLFKDAKFTNNKRERYWITRKGRHGLV